MNRKIIIIISAAFVLLVSCTASRFKSEERWEGIWFNKLRVHVAMDIQGTGDSRENTTEIVQKASRDRAAILLTSYIMHRVGVNVSGTELGKRVREALKTGKILYMDCTDYRCEAFTEYRVKPVLLLLDSYKKNDSDVPSRK